MKKLFIVSLWFWHVFAIGLTWAGESVIIAAEGLADPESPAYQKDKGLLIDALRADARKQVIEKAVGVYVQSSTLMENYDIIHDRILTQSQGFIKKIIKESDPWLGEDGFWHLLLKAEVVTGQVQKALEAMSQQERIQLLKQHENPRISVAVWVQDANRASDVPPQRSDVAENLLKEHIKAFGYRVWSADAPESKLDRADFAITGQVKFKPISLKLPRSGLTITKYALTSWTVKCVNLANNEEIYFNNKVPLKKTWADEDAALADIGQLIGKEFSSDFFEKHLSASSQIYQLRVKGLPSFDVASLLKKEFLGLRPVLNVDLRNFDRNGLSLYEIEFAGGRDDFQGFINNAVLEPLNRKLGQAQFLFDASAGGVVDISYQGQQSEAQLMQQFNAIPPASLAHAAPTRLKDMQLSEAATQKVAALNPQAVQSAQPGVSQPSTVKNIADF